jgi:hypothetical protein
MAKKSKSASKSRPATTADAQVVLHLYDQRTEAAMRKARKFVLLEFWPKSYEEFIAMATAFGTEHQTHLRQVASYWDQACALAVRGAVHEDVFVDYAGEAFVLYAKYEPFLARFRKDVNPAFFMNVEKLVTATADRKQRIKNIQTGTLPRLAAALAAGAGR